MPELGDETLRKIAHELAESLRQNGSVDWAVRDNVRLGQIQSPSGSIWRRCHRSDSRMRRRRPKSLTADFSYAPQAVLRTFYKTGTPSMAGASQADRKLVVLGGADKFNIFKIVDVLRECITILVAAALVHLFPIYEDFIGCIREQHLSLSICQLDAIR